MEFTKNQNDELNALIAAMIANGAFSDVDDDDEDDIEENEEDVETEDALPEVVRLIDWLIAKGMSAEEILDCIRYMAAEDKE